MRSAPPLACFVLSRAALPLALRLAEALAVEPWPSPSGAVAGEARLYAPARFCPQDGLADAPGACHHPRVQPFESLADILKSHYRSHSAHIFVGAAGIAVRSLAPVLRHKSLDPPTVVLSPDGRFAVSLVSGHWGGGNALARHIARLVGACPVITTASDTQNKNVLDMLLRDAGLRILDWDALPKAQAALLEGAALPLWDPCRALADTLPPGLERIVPERPDDGSSADIADLPLAAQGASPFLAVHWRALPRLPNLLRCAVPWLYVGLGCRKGVPREAVLDAIVSCCAAVGLETRAIAALVTAREKREEAAIAYAAASLDVPLLAFPAETLAGCPSPNPSLAAARRFGQKPFSVCEAAALIAAGRSGRLVLPKRKIDGRLTIAVALGPRSGRKEA